MKSSSLFSLIIPLLVFTMIPVKTYGQQDPLYSQYTFNLLTANPAYSGLRNQSDFTLSSRFQWAGVDGSPTTHVFTANSSIMEERGGIGVMLLTDKIGIDRSTEGHLAYSYKIGWNDFQISFGLQAGFISLRQNLEGLNLRVFDDPFFIASEQHAVKLNFGTGVIVKGDKFLVGFSIPKMINNSFDNDEFGGISYRRHYFLTGAYLLEASNGVMFKPMVMIRAVDGAPLSFSFNATAMFNNRYWVGVFTNNFNTLGSMIQLEINSSYKFGYSFEIFNERNLGSRFSSHELFLRVSFELFKNQSIYQHYF